MADIQASPVTRGGKPRAKKHAFRLDMTPMVDLAFLLLTFFMLTTTFNKPSVMDLQMPVQDAAKQKSPVSDKKALTLILGRGGQVHYFFGLNEAGNAAQAAATKLFTTDFSASGLRQVLLRRQQQQPAPIVLIKTGPGATYQDLVNALDEMNITDQKKYALTELDLADRQLLASRNL